MLQFSSAAVVCPEDFFAATNSNLTDLLHWMVKEVNQLRQTKQIPSIDNFLDSFDPLGVAVSLNHPGATFWGKDWFLIHWPTVLRGVDKALAMGDFSIVAILWHFREVLYRRSVTFHDLLRRRIAQQLVYQYYPLTEEEKRQQGYFELSPAEETAYRGLLESVIVQPKTLTALRTSFEESLTPRGKGRGLRGKLYPSSHDRTRILACVGEVNPNECSIFSYRALGKYRPQLAAERRVVKVTGPGFGPSVMNDDFKEICYAFHYRDVDQGVLRLSKRLLAINLYRYIPYRAQFTAYYKNCVGHKTYGNLAETCSKMRGYWETIFEPMIVHGAIILHRERLAATWGDGALEYIVFLAADGITNRLQNAARMEHLRTLRHRTSPKPPTERVPRLYALESPPLSDFGHVELKFQAIQRSPGLFWNVPWEVPLSEHYHKLSDAGRIQSLDPEDLPSKSELKPGVVYVEAFASYFYSLDFLLGLFDLPDNPLRQSRLLLEWMKNYSDMPPRQFRLLQGGARRVLVAQQQRRPGRTLKGITWTKEEDAAICKLYRPGMTEYDEAKLLRICRGRTMRAVLRRAKVIREDLLARGVYDPDLLPHRNYNATLKKLVQAAKDKAAAVDSAGGAVQ